MLYIFAINSSIRKSLRNKFNKLKCSNAYINIEFQKSQILNLYEM